MSLFNQEPFQGRMFDVTRQHHSVQGIQHCLTMHANYATKLTSGERRKGPENVFQLNCQAKYFYKAVDHPIIGNQIGYMLSWAFSDGEYLKNGMVEAASIPSPDNKGQFKNGSLALINIKTFWTYAYFYQYGPLAYNEKIVSGLAVTSSKCTLNG